jgi:hypothetical protein
MQVSRFTDLTTHHGAGSWRQIIYYRYPGTLLRSLPGGTGTTVGIDPRSESRTIPTSLYMAVPATVSLETNHQKGSVQFQLVEGV